MREAEKRVEEIQAQMDELRSGGPSRSDELFEILPGSLPQKRDESATLNRLKQLKEMAAREKELEDEREKRTAETAARIAQREAEQRGQELEGVRNFFKTREQLGLESYDRREEIINANMEAGAERDALLLENERARAQYRIDLERYAQDEINAAVMSGVFTRDQFEQASADAKAKYLIGKLRMMTQGVAQHNRTMFALNKVASIGNAVINIHEGITAALALPPPFSFAMAAAVAAAGATEIAAIRSASFGGGSTPSAIGSTPVLDGQPVSNPSSETPGTAATSRTITEVHIHGSVVARDDLKHIFEDLFESDEVIIQGNTPQAAAIRSGR